MLASNFIRYKTNMLGNIQCINHSLEAKQEEMLKAKLKRKLEAKLKHMLGAIQKQMSEAKLAC